MAVQGGSAAHAAATVRPAVVGPLRARGHLHPIFCPEADGTEGRDAAGQPKRMTTLRLAAGEGSADRGPLRHGRAGSQLQPRRGGCGHSTDRVYPRRWNKLSHGHADRSGTAVDTGKTGGNGRGMSQKEQPCRKAAHEMHEEKQDCPFHEDICPFLRINRPH